MADFILDGKEALAQSSRAFEDYQTAQRKISQAAGSAIIRGGCVTEDTGLFLALGFPYISPDFKGTPENDAYRQLHERIEGVRNGLGKVAAFVAGRSAEPQSFGIIRAAKSGRERWGMMRTNTEPSLDGLQFPHLAMSVTSFVEAGYGSNREEDWYDAKAVVLLDQLQASRWVTKSVTIVEFRAARAYNHALNPTLLIGVPEILASATLSNNWKANLSGLQDAELARLNGEVIGLQSPVENVGVA